MGIGWLGIVGGAVLVLVSGIIGTYRGVTNSSGPRERAFMVRACLLGWGGGLLFVLVFFLLPWPYTLLAGMFYGGLTPWITRFLNRIRLRIRWNESGDNPDKSSPIAV